VIPPLRERTGEIALLARQFLEAAATRAGRPPPVLPDATVRLLVEHPWPGNVRELKNAIDRLVVLCPEPVLLPEHVVALGALRPRPMAEPAPASSRARAVEPPPSEGSTLRAELNAVERERIERALESCQGNQSRAATLLGMSRRSLIRRLEAYGIKRPLKDG
jgi:DNA-binding NtrC family response regulator